MNILLLAAGLGTRLRPLTTRMPKPLVPVADANGLSLQLESVAGLSPRHICANAHYLHQQVEAWAASDGRLSQVFVEQPEILGTGAPLQRMRAAGFDDELLVMNGDVLHTLDLEAFVTEARSSGAPSALLAFDNPAVNTLVFHEGRLLGLKGRWGAQEARNSTFTGIAWYGPEALARIAADCTDIRDFWRQEVDAGRAPAVCTQSSSALWIDTGSPEGLLRASMERLRQKGRRLYADRALPGAVGVERASVHGRVRFAGTAFLKDVVLYGPTSSGELVIPDGAVLERCIVGEDFSWMDLAFERGGAS